MKFTGWLLMIVALVSLSMPSRVYAAPSVTVSVKWTTSGDVTLRSVRVQKRVNGGAWSTLCTVTEVATVTECRDVNLPFGSVYEYNVVESNDFGDSNPVPNVPLRLSATATSGAKTTTLVYAVTP